jgi:crotonobetainyl-CoA:carnitine CoA-transferase CaiB-like acyl-CoA transferase
MKMPLEGVRIVDWTIWHQGSLASSMLGDLGAEVIKVEDRVSGDPGRGLMKVVDAASGIVGRNFYFECNNRRKGKRSSTVWWKSQTYSCRTSAQA